MLHSDNKSGRGGKESWKMFAAKILYFAYFLATCQSAFIGPKDSKCGYESCNPVKDDMINVHLVPHTHDDVGWLKTVDQYYYGSKNGIQNAGVQYVLDSVVRELLTDPTKRFIYVEIAFFARWWREQHDSMRHLVKGLVNNGQLEFILGGWCMNDEAATHYNAIIDQHSLGFEFLRQNFGECGRPKIGWQIDPFGHSREQASIFAQFGFDGMFFGRLDFQDKNERLKNVTMEMLWHGSPKNLGVKADLFTGVLPNMYQPPQGFCFDIFCSDEPIMDDKRLHDYNVDQKVKDFIKAVEEQAIHYKTNHIVMTMGSDFLYQNANHWYKNLDKLIEYTNRLQTTNNSKINVLYSTPSCYLYQLNRADQVWTTKSDDFFPYAHQNHSFWTGYFTSRSALKGYVRETNALLQACKQLDALAMLEDIHNSTYNIQILKEAMGVAQHHDAVSGTEKQAVADDYAMRLAYGRSECKKVMNDALGKLIPKGSEGFPGLVWCDMYNISSCSFTEVNKQFVMVVYNPLGHSVTRWIRLPVVGKAYTVMGPYNEVIETQMSSVTDRTKDIPERNGSLAYSDLIFQVKLPPLGFSTYFVSMSNSAMKKKQQKPVKKMLKGNEDFVIKNEHISVKFDGRTGAMKSMTNLASGRELDVVQDIVYYLSHPGNCSKPEFEPSGAYVFRPLHEKPETWKVSYPGDASQGPLVQEIYTKFSSWVTQVTRVYTGEKYTEIEWTVGPIPINDKQGKEVIARFNTSLKTNGKFYTDANGREILERQRNYRPTWKLNQTEPVAGNYYPVNSRIFMQDTKEDTQFTVMTDRSHGGGSINDGQIEIMLHRRNLFDDCLGVGEPLNETGADHKGLIVRGKMYVFMDTVANSAKMHRDLGLRTYMAPIPAFAKTDMKYSEYSQYFNTMWSGIKSPLPANVHMLTLEQWGGPAIEPAATQPYLIRLEHFYEKGEDAELSQPATVSLQDLFVPFNIESVEELTLGANLPKSQLNRLKWKSQDKILTDKQNMYMVENRVPLTGPLDITLTPMQIRTFEVNLKNGKPVNAADKFSVFS
ncbi:lysosomal alpha-mannosidase-like isoform X2 [Ruditapes philippinarum]|uniref:lysosomal alpha-mannosidase-like isoform X2 n=1 Tax=Ruditapes philippinarum TaxID=129788 RepID=UPI00295A9532|nr:lysosomal alpha-mannosidase-like isoform X2 [Ruditapes philippinarum]